MVQRFVVSTCYINDLAFHVQHPTQSDQVETKYEIVDPYNEFQFQSYSPFKVTFQLSLIPGQLAWEYDFHEINPLYSPKCNI